MVSSVDRVKSFLVVPKLGLSSVDDPQRLSGTWLKFLNLSVSSLINIYNNLFDWKIQVLPKKQIIPIDLQDTGVRSRRTVRLNIAHLVIVLSFSSTQLIQSLSFLSESYSTSYIGLSWRIVDLFSKTKVKMLCLKNPPNIAKCLERIK